MLFRHEGRTNDVIVHMQREIVQQQQQRSRTKGKGERTTNEEAF
jgi:hypothetical protein